MRKQLRNATLLVLTALLFATSCKKDSETFIGVGFSAPGTALVINEGTSGNADITYIGTNDSVFNNVFTSVNKVPLGTFLQSYDKSTEYGLCIVNGNAKVEVVDASTFESVATLTDNLDYPRYVLVYDESTAYITNGNGTGTVVIIDLDNLTVSGTIAIGSHPENIIKVGNLIYVANGRFGNDSTISIINPISQTLVSTINVGTGPSDLVQDNDENIWLLCERIWKSDFSSLLNSARLVKISSANNTVLTEIEIVADDPTSFDNISRLEISPDKQTLYYLKGGAIYKQSVNSSVPETAPFIAGNFYGINVNPSTGDIWATVSEFTMNSSVNIYASDGTLKASYPVGIGPNGVFFN